MCHSKKFPKVDPKTIHVGDTVCKRTRKKFKNKRRLAIVIDLCTMYIPITGKRKYGVQRGRLTPGGGVLLESCGRPVTVMTIHKDANELHLCERRDEMDSNRDDIWRDFYVDAAKNR